MPITAGEARRSLTGRQIWLWHYMHADWQWEQSRQWHEERYALAVREALDIMQEDPDFRYFFDAASEFFSAVEQRLGPRLEELKERVSQGRVRVLSAQVANCRPTQVGDETYIRNIQLGRHYFETHLPPTEISLFHSVDVAIGGVQMPQLLSQLGFEYYRAWRPHGPMNVLGIPHQFVWQGVDGSRILVTRGSYGGWLGDAPINDEQAGWDTVVTWVYDSFFRDQVLHDRSRSDHLWLIQGADDARPLRNWYADRPDDVRGFVARWREREAAPIHWCTPLEFSQAVASQRDRLPVVEGVLDAADCGYNIANHGSGGLWSWRQMNDRRLLEGEWWAAAARSASFHAPQEELRRLWHQHCTYQAHAQDHAFKGDWDFLVERARDVRGRANEIRDAALGAIVAAAGGGTHTTRYLFNPLPWPLEADVELYHPCVTAGVAALQVVDENGSPLAQQPLRELRHPRYGGSLADAECLVRLELPAMGYRRVEVIEHSAPGAAALGKTSEPPPASRDCELLAGGLKLIYRDHALREVHDLAGGWRYASREGLPWPGLYYHVLDRQDWLFAGPEVRRERFVPEESCWLETGPLRWRHCCTGALGPYGARLETLWDGASAGAAGRGRELQVAVRLEGHWETAPVTGFATILADIRAGGAITVDVPFAVEPRDPDHDVYSDDVPPGRADLGIDSMMERLRPGVFWGRSWADWSDGTQGVTLISVDGCTYWLKEPDRFGHILLRGVDLKPGTWEARCPVSLTGAGVHHFRYAFRFHDGAWRQADPQRRSLELRYPPSVARADYPNSAVLPPGSHSFMSLEGPALISAYYREGGAAILRVYEHTGRGGEAAITLDWSPSSVQAVDLLGCEVDATVAHRANRIRLQLRPWQIATLKLYDPTA